ncbi:MAG: hypothetical protein JJT88_20450 [Gammaproteobacteria bacterium]|nr:hypothetical protein [Gammaproteobacteria bacterium]
MIIVVIVAVVALLISRMPSGFSSDLSRVGDDIVTVVLVHDHNFVASIELMDKLNRVRGEFEPEVKFLVADPNHPDGRAFIQTHDLAIIRLYVFDAAGNLRAERRHQGDIQSLRRFLKDNTQ